MRFIDYFQQYLQKGECTFAAYMHEALYAPNFGYYSSGATLFGKEGDYTTAPELSPLFGQTLALQCHQILSQIKNPILFEFGAGTGKLCVDILQQLKKLNALPREYHILELSGHLKARQQALIQKELPDYYPQVKWHTKWPETPFSGVVIANEVLDAMPIHRFLQTETGIMESMVSYHQESKQLVETFKPCTNEQLIAYIHEVIPRHQYPYLSEANLLLEGWLRECFHMLQSGAVILIDYGFPRHEYYHPDRNQGTLMCHWRHHAHTNPLAYPGEQDITAHVDFTEVALIAEKEGFNIAGYTNQASFLINNGILDLVKPDTSTQALKCLLQPSEMGELFKVIALTKHLDIPLAGFQINDKRNSL